MSEFCLSWACTGLVHPFYVHRPKQDEMTMNEHFNTVTRLVYHGKSCVNKSQGKDVDQSVSNSLK